MYLYAVFKLFRSIYSLKSQAFHYNTGARRDSETDPDPVIDFMVLISKNGKN